MRKAKTLTPTYSFVIPIYNETENLGELERRMDSLMGDLDGTCELILVDDGSHDGSLDILRDMSSKDSRIRYLSLARNFGHQAAVTAGLEAASGDAIIVMDADLQDPPEIVLKMATKWREGNQVVYAQRLSRENEGWFKRSTAFAYYRVLRFLSDVDVPADTGDFCLMDRAVVDILNQMPERHRYIRGLRSWIGFRQTAVCFKRPPRFAGEVKYTFSKSLKLAMDGIVSFSLRPLRLATYLGFMAAGISLVMIGLVLYWRLFQQDSPIIGHSVVAAALFFVAASLLICLGILGEYVGRIYDEVKGRPIFTLKEQGGFAESIRSEQAPKAAIEASAFA